MKLICHFKVSCALMGGTFHQGTFEVTPDTPDRMRVEALLILDQMGVWVIGEDEDSCNLSLKIEPQLTEMKNES